MSIVRIIFAAIVIIVVPVAAIGADNVAFGLRSGRKLCAFDGVANKCVPGQLRTGAVLGTIIGSTYYYANSNFKSGTGTGARDQFYAVRDIHSAAPSFSTASENTVRVNRGIFGSSMHAIAPLAPSYPDCCILRGGCRSVTSVSSCRRSRIRHARRSHLRLHSS